MNMPYPKQYAFSDTDTKIEGFVIKDANGNMIKIKNPWYVSAHHMKGENTNKSILDIWLSNEASEFLSYFPEMTEKYNLVKNFMIEKYTEIENVIQEIDRCKFSTRKDIALYIQSHGNYSIIWKYIRDDLSVISPYENSMIEDIMMEDIRQFLYGKFKDEVIKMLKEIV
jgi:hypothetical protein